MTVTLTMSLTIPTVNTRGQSILSYPRQHQVAVDILLYDLILVVDLQSVQ